MQDDNTQDSKSSLLERIVMWLFIRKAVRKTKANIRHGKMMAAFYTHQAENEPDKQISGKLTLKATQLEDSYEQEEKFLDFISNHY